MYEQQIIFIYIHLILQLSVFRMRLGCTLLIDPSKSTLFVKGSKGTGEDFIKYLENSHLHNAV